MGDLPSYRLFRYAEPYDHWVVDLLLAMVDVEAPEYDADDSWTHTVKSRTISITSTREAAEAAMRLLGAERYQDWTQPGGWGAPWVTLQVSDEESTIRPCSPSDSAFR